MQAAPIPAQLGSLAALLDEQAGRSSPEVRCRHPRASRRWLRPSPRDRAGPKVIALHRTDRGRFALDETGDWQPSIKTTIVTPREARLSVAFVCGVRNSELLDLWYALRGRTPWHVRRDYEPKPMNEMPYRHVPVPEQHAPSAAVRQLRCALDSQDMDAVVRSADIVRVSIGTPEGDADAVLAIEHLVRAIAANRRALLPLRSIAPELSRAVKSPWRTHGVVVDRAAVLAEMPAAALRSVRLDPELALTIATDGVLGRPRREGRALTFRYASKVTARVEGPENRVALLADLLGSRRLLPEDLRTARVPVSLDALAVEVARRQEEIGGLLSEGRLLVEAVERLVCALYGLPDALTELVVASAVTRSGTVGEDEG